MSVPKWRRDLSRTQFLYEIFQLNIKIGNIIANAPTKKYAHSYGNALTITAQQALMHAQTGNEIRVMSDSTFDTRQREFQLAIGQVENIATVAYIYLETMRRHDNVTPEKREKMYNWEDEIGEQTDLIINYLYKVMKNDREVWTAKKKKYGLQ